MIEMAKLILIIAVALAVSLCAAAEEEPEVIFSSASYVTINWIEQKLDHFNKSDTRTWQMRYMVINDFYEPGGPLFITLPGIRSISEGHTIRDVFYDTAKEHNALLLVTEHRFYGESRPAEDMTIENLKYLDVKQALADLAHFVRYIKLSSHSMNNAKVILFGSDYGGSMVTWFKKLYPDLAVGGWAASASLLAKLDFKEVKEEVGQSIRLLGGDSCYNRIANSVKEMEKMLAEQRTAELKSAFNTCNFVNTSDVLDVTIFTSFIFHPFYKNLQSENLRDQKIKNECEKLMRGPDDFKSLSNYLVNYYGNTSCNDFTYNNEMAASKNTTFETGSVRPWFYQACNEFGLFLTTTSTQQPFGTKTPLSFFPLMCKDLFSDKFTLEYMESQVKKTNQLFGGRNPQVENVYMTYGQLDPWLPAGIQDVKRATIIPTCSTYCDLDSTGDKESKEIKAAKMKFKELVKKWLKA